MIKNLKFHQPFISEENNNASSFEKTFLLTNLQKGFGNTLGNSLRRVLLSSLPGIALFNVKIKGIHHEFSTIAGIQEDVMTIIMNLKKVLFTTDDLLNSDFEVKINLDVSGEKTVTAGDLQFDEQQLQVINPEQEIAHLVSKEAKLFLTATLKTGIGYVSAEENKKNFPAEIGLIAVDSLFSPVENVVFEVEQDLNQKDKIIMTIITNGIISSKDALVMAAKILADHFNSIAILSSKKIPNFIISPEELFEERKKAEEEEKAKMLNNVISLEQMNFSARLLTALKNANIYDVGTIIKLGKDHIMNLKNLGKKSFDELVDKLQTIGLAFEEEN